MRVLRLVAVNDSGSHLLLRAEGDGTEFVLPLDSRIRAAVNGDKERLGQLEVPLDTQIRPREIQSRIRAGHSVEAVAHSANVSVERVMRYAGPVLAERSHIADLARRSALRRSGGTGPAPMLDDAVSTELVRQGVPEDSIEWDAFRRDDGRWVVQAGWQLDGAGHSAQWTYDPGGRSVAPADDDARWLSGERPPAPAPQPGPARLTVVGRDGQHEQDNIRPLVPAGGHRAERDPQAAIEPDTDGFGAADELDFVEDFAADHRDPHGDDEDDAPTVEVPSVAGEPTGQEDSRLRLSDIASHIEIEGDDHDDTGERPDSHPRAAANGGQRNRRPSVPSWDEIMFGSRRSPD